MGKMFSLTVHSTNKAGKRTALGHKIEAASKEEAALKAIAHHAKIGHKNIRVTHHELKEEVKQLDETWIHVKSHQDFVKHVKANHPDAVHVRHQNNISQAVVGPRKNPVGHWDHELGVGRVKKSHLTEEQDEYEILDEEFSTREAAEKALEKHNARHPTAKHSVIQGRRSGKWHVVRHTSGGMHIVEADEHGFPDDLDHIASLTSNPPVERMHELHKDHQKKIRAFVKSKHWKEVDKKHTDPHTGEKHAGGHVDDDFHKAFKKWHKETYGTTHEPFKPLQEVVEIAKEAEWKSWLSTEYPGQTKFEPKYAVDPLKASKVATVKELVKSKKS